MQDDFCTYMQLELQERDDVVIHSKMVCYYVRCEICCYCTYDESSSLMTVVCLTVPFLFQLSESSIDR